MSTLHPAVGDVHTQERAAQASRTDAVGAVGASWLIRVRWGAAFGQIATLLIAHWALGYTLPLTPLFAIVGLSAATNLAAAHLLRRRAPVATTSGISGTLLAIDTLLLTVSLALTGGPLNPFSEFYLVYITLAAVVLGARWTWFLTVLAACCYGSLFFLHALQALPAATPSHGAHAPPLGLSSHLQGMWWAFLVAASLTAFFVVKLSSAIERRDRELARMREQALRSERLASLTTLAAGAAHELSTPLGTIAVVTGEIERALEQLRAAVPDMHATASGATASAAATSNAAVANAAAARISEALLTDARLIRAELQRCRGILDRMATQAGETVGEMPAPVSVGVLVAEALHALPPDEAARVRVETPDAVATLTVPGRGVVTALVSLLRNALDASERTQTITLAATAGDSDGRLRGDGAGGTGGFGSAGGRRQGPREGRGENQDDHGGTRPQIVRLIVRDRGTGMAPDVLSRAGEPFFSTKPAGAGMGLGLFLTRALAERLGGALRLDSTPGEGTAAMLELPANPNTREAR